jgi:23S rRNA pseudouridine2605 synthase
MEMRVNRFLSQAGMGSRRAVEELIRQGRVRVNGETLSDLGRRIGPDVDEVQVDGRIVELHPPQSLLLFHKPLGVVCSMRQQDSRPCLSNVLDPALWEGRRLFHVGRLDSDSSGLLLLSDDGDLAQALERPSGEIWKRYRVRVDRALSPESLQKLRDGSIVLDGRPCLPARAEVFPTSRRSLVIELHEGRNRQIRRMLSAVGANVTHLQRTHVGPLELGDLAEGHARNASAAEISQLRKAVDASAGDDRPGRE